MATKVNWLGHSCILLESDGHRLLIDPFLPAELEPPIAADEVPADFILVSHGHFDHVGDTIAISKRTGATVICNFEISEWLSKQGVKAHGMQPGGGYTFPFGRLKMTLAFHSSMLPDGSDGGAPGGFLIALNDGVRIYDAADTALFSDMRLIGEDGLDLAFLPIGDNFTMGPDDSIRAIKLLQPRRVVPIHFNTFPVIAQDPEAWAARVKRETLTQPVIHSKGTWFDV